MIIEGNLPDLIIWFKPLIYKYQLREFCCCSKAPLVSFNVNIWYETTSTEISNHILKAKSAPGGMDCKSGKRNSFPTLPRGFEAILTTLYFHLGGKKNKPVKY